MTETDDEALHDAIRAADPVRDQPDRSMRASGPELREKSESRQRFRVHKLIATAIVLAVLVVLMAGMWLGGRLFPQPQIGPSDWPTTLHGVKADVPLYALAESIQSSPVDAQTGNVTYVEIERWYHLDSSPDGRDVGGAREKRWSANDGSVRLAGQRVVVDVSQTFDRSRIGKDFAGVEPYVVDYRPGQLKTYFMGQPSTSPAQLIQQLTAQQCAVTMLRPSPCPPTAIEPGRIAELLFDAITSLHRTEIPTLEIRRTLLTALGGTPGVTSHGIVTDPLGREGLAVLYIASGVTRTLIFDLRSGELLVSDTVVQGGPGLSHYVLYVARGRSETVG